MDTLLTLHLRTLRILNLAFLFALAVCATVALTFITKSTEPIGSHTTILWTLLLVGAVNIVTIMPAQRFLTSRAEKNSDDIPNCRSLFRFHRLAHIITLARLEANGILGLVIFILLKDPLVMAIFLVSSATGILIVWPRRTTIEELLEPQSGFQPTESD
jgi:hypothetical protein